MNPIERFLGAIGATVAGAVGGANAPAERPPARPGIAATMPTPPLPVPNPLRVVTVVLAEAPAAAASPAAVEIAAPAPEALAGAAPPGVPVMATARGPAAPGDAVLPPGLAEGPLTPPANFSPAATDQPLPGVLELGAVAAAGADAPPAGVLGPPAAGSLVATGVTPLATDPNLAQRFADAMPAFAAYQAFAPGMPTAAMAAFAALEAPNGIPLGGLVVAPADAPPAPEAAPSDAAGVQERAAAAASEAEAGIGLLALADVPLPRARPAPPRRSAAAAARTDVALADFTGRRPPAGRPSDAACMTALAALGITAEMLPPIRANSCGVAAPLQVSEVRGSTAVELTPDATVNCQVAAAVDRWLEGSVQPAAQRYLGGRITGVRVAAGYACRGRNNNPRASLSEHAFGNAIDISAFRTERGEWVAVQPATAAGPMAARFLDEVREGACGPFTTVLGPGVPLHNDHFHLDLARRGRSGDSTYCR